MAASSYVALETFRRHSAELLKAIQDPECIAWELYANGVITVAAVDEMGTLGLSTTQKKSKLLSCVGGQVGVDPTKLDKFVEVLKKQPPMLELARRLERTLYDLMGQFPTLPAQLHQPQPSIAVSLPWQPPSIDAAVGEYASYLKRVYLRQKFPTYGKWPPNPAKKFINLALIKKERMSKEKMDHFVKQTVRGEIDDIVEEKESLSLQEICQAKENVPPKCVLVEGAPGIGKSTFAWKLCRKWSKGKLLHQYRLVVLLRLRDKRVREAKSVSDLFYYYNHQIQQTVVEEIQATGGRGVLLLFEGYDELPAKLRAKGSTFLDVITNQELQEATVLVTSRPSASGILYEECRDFIAQHVEILGFTQENIQSYLRSTIGHDTSLLQGLQQYLMYYPHIKSMVYIPLNCAIVVEVYRVYKSSKSLIPKTWTDLYSSLLRSLLLRYLDDHPVYKRQSWKSNSFHDLPADVYQQLCEVGRVAYEGILQGQQVILSDLPSDFDSLGLMQCVPELYVDEVAADSFNFLHLTLQEYMAALYLSEQPVEKQMELFQKYRQQIPTLLELHQHSIHFQTVLRFLAGLKKFTGYPTSSIRSLLAGYPKLIPTQALCPRSCDSSSKLWISLEGLHWMFEATCNTGNVCEAIGMSIVGVALSETVTLFDCFVLGHCMSHSSCPWEVNLNSCGGIGDEGVEMLVRGAMEGGIKHSGYISVMKIFGINSYCTSVGLNQLLKIPELLQLRELDLSFNHIRRGGAVLLLKSPLVHNLEKLTLARTGIGVEDCQVLSELLSSSPTLQRINISSNALPPEAVELIITGLNNHTVLEELDIGGSQFDLQNCISLASVTQPPRDLNLQSCHINDERAVELAKLLNQSSVRSICLLGNPIGIKGAAAFAIKLLQTTSLIKLELNHESIGLEGTRKLIDSILQNSTLKVLRLPGGYECSVGEAYRRVKDRIKWGDDLFSGYTEVSHFPSTLSICRPQRPDQEEGGDSLDSDSEVEDWKTPPTSPTQPGSYTLDPSLNAGPPRD